MFLLAVRLRRGSIVIGVRHGLTELEGKYDCMGCIVGDKSRHIMHGGGPTRSYNVKVPRKALLPLSVRDEIFHMVPGGFAPKLQDIAGCEKGTRLPLGDCGLA